jgi:transcriptional regulator GlxA family with amidase domain
MQTPITSWARGELATRRVVMLAFDDAQILDITGPLEVFSRAARLASDEGRRGVAPYTVEIVAPKRGRIRMSSGLELIASRRLADVRGGIDTLFVSGGRGARKAAGDPAVIRWLRRLAPRVRRLASVCNGTRLLAEAGLLDGKRVTTHWADAAELAAAYSSVTFDPDPIFLRAGKVYTSAGVTAGMDLALAMVEEDHGAKLARAVARQLVLFLQRPGGQSQFSAQLEVQLADRSPLRELTAWMADHLAADQSVEALARRAAMSPRNFARAFRREVGAPPGRFVERLRVEAARRRLVESEATIVAVAQTCGFGTAETMRRAFQRTLRVAPHEYRKRFAHAGSEAR